MQAMLDSGFGQNKIAKILKVDPATVSREISRNRKRVRRKGGTVPGIYEAETAGHKAMVRREKSKYQCMKIEKNNDLITYITDKLKQCWNPDEISGRMRNDNEPFYASKSSIFQYLIRNIE